MATRRDRPHWRKIKGSAHNYNNRRTMRRWQFDEDGNEMDPTRRPMFRPKKDNVSEKALAFRPKRLLRRCVNMPFADVHAKLLVQFRQVPHGVVLRLSYEAECAWLIGESAFHERWTWRRNVPMFTVDERGVLRWAAREASSAIIQRVSHTCWYAYLEHVDHGWAWYKLQRGPVSMDYSVMGQFDYWSWKALEHSDIFRDNDYCYDVVAVRIGKKND